MQTRQLIILICVLKFLGLGIIFGLKVYFIHGKPCNIVSQTMYSKVEL